MPESLTDLSQRLARQLKRTGQRLVLAESCTAGLVAASLASVPGVSDQFCGSAVTYRDDTKRQWLDVSVEDLRCMGAVSETVARQMVQGVLEATPEADLAAAVTGHLGPDAPADQDGLVFIAFGRRQVGAAGAVAVQKIQLEATQRVARQQEAAARVLQVVMAELQQVADTMPRDMT